MKTCTKCQQSKLLVEFSKNKARADGHHSHCKACQKIYFEQHYKKNKEYYCDKSWARYNETQEWLLEFKTTLKCARCGENHPACLDFHHTDPDKKDIQVSNAARQGWSIERIKSEIEKCEVVCANCHRKLHWNEK